MTTDIRPRVLLVDDEVLILDLVRDALDDAGYSPDVADSADAALQSIEANGAHLAALVTDIRLGDGLSGWELAARAREVSGSLAVVYVTGDNAHEWSSKGVPMSTVIMKPFAPSQVVVAIASLLNRTDDGV